MAKNNKNKPAGESPERSALLAMILATALNPGTPWRD
jgi:hypothetical protein